jgi:hypothetical protein
MPALLAFELELQTASTITSISDNAEEVMLVRDILSFDTTRPRDPAIIPHLQPDSRLSVDSQLTLFFFSSAIA